MHRLSVWTGDMKSLTPWFTNVELTNAGLPDNLTRLASALEPLSRYLRGAPRGLPFRLDGPTLARGLNFTLTCTLGDLDLMGEVAGGGTYEQLRPNTRRIRVFDVEVDVVTQPQLIRLKRAAGRPKDLEALAELEVLLDEQRSGGADDTASRRIP